MLLFLAMANESHKEMQIYKMYEIHSKYDNKIISLDLTEQSTEPMKLTLLVHISAIILYIDILQNNTSIYNANLCLNILFSH